MELNFIPVNTNPNRSKATIHISGRLGFNAEAIKLMKLEDKKYFKVALEAGDDSAAKIYLLPTEEEGNNAKLAKAGDYYYLNVGDTFDNLKLNYEEYTISFDVSKDKYQGMDLFVLKKRKLKKRKNKNSEDDDE
jgi:hypothetical protein